MAKELSQKTVNRTFRREPVSEQHIEQLAKITGEAFSVLVKRLLREEYERRTAKPRE